MSTYTELVDEHHRRGAVNLGPTTSYAYRDDPKRLAFMCSRYKFVAKMLVGCDRVLEVGCGDGFGTRIVGQHVGSMIAIDEIDDLLPQSEGNIEFEHGDIFDYKIVELFDAVYCLDVLEHIERAFEHKFVNIMKHILLADGICIIGSPSIESQVYASKYSRAEHVNCKTQDQLRSLMLEYFDNVFMFSMNDEIIGTGFAGMSHYNIALCCGPR